MRYSLFFVVLWTAQAVVSASDSLSGYIIIDTQKKVDAQKVDRMLYVPSPEEMEHRAKWVAEQTLVSEEDLKLVDFYWTGMFEQMSRLKSGHLHLKREIVNLEVELPRKQEYQLRIELYDFYFDYTKDFYRFERVEKGGRVDTGKDRKHVFVKNKDATLFYDEIVVVKKTPTSEPPFYLADPFDARYVGTLASASFNSIGRVEKFEKIRQYFNSPAVRVITAQTLNDTVFQITSFGEDPRYPVISEWIHQIDSSRGFSPSQTQHYERLFIKGKETRRITSDRSFDYKEFGPPNDRVWLPVKWVKQSYNG